MRYDHRNQLILNEVHPALRYKLMLVLDILEFRGEDVLLYEGNRTNAEQQIEWQKGRDENGNVVGTTVTNAKPGYSLHNYGLAVDFAPVGPLGIELSKRNNLEWTAIGRYEAIAFVAAENGLESGAFWRTVDRPHLQFTGGLTLAQIRAGKRPSSETARKELLAYYQNRIDNAKRAIDKVDPGRRLELAAFISRYERKKEDLG